MEKCGITNCTSTDNRFLWKCEGICKRHFHAACVGTRRNQEELLRSFMLPLCIECQEQFMDQLQLKKLIQHQKILTESIESQIKSNHSIISQLPKLTVTHDTLDSINTLLSELKTEIKKVNINTNNASAKTINRISTLFGELGHDSISDISDISKENRQHTKNIQQHLEKAFTNIESKIDNMEHQLEAIQNKKTNCSTTAQELINELKALKESNSLQPKTDNHPSLAEELRLSLPLPESDSEEHRTPNFTSGWRLIGNKKVWKRDWTEYDARQRKRRMQEKQAEKAARKRMQQRKRQQENSNPISISNNTYKHGINHFACNSKKTQIAEMPKQPLPSDKDLLAAARVQFAGPPNSDITSKFINFQKGETINPYRTEKNATNNENSAPAPASNASIQSAPQDSQFELDPMRPPIVRLTQQSSNGDERFLKARLRDPKVMHITRLYLAYMKDQPSSVCVEGMTPTSIRMLLASEGLPTSPEQLQRVFIEVHQEYGLTPAEAVADLQSYRHFLSNERTHRLQQLRESVNKFSTNFRK